MKMIKLVVQLPSVTSRHLLNNLSHRSRSARLSISSHTCLLSSKLSTMEFLPATCKLIVDRQRELSSQVPISQWLYSTSFKLRYLIRRMGLQHRLSRFIPMLWTKLKLIQVSIRGRDKCWQIWSVRKKKPSKDKEKNVSKLGDRWRHKSSCSMRLSVDSKKPSIRSKRRLS